MLVYISDKRACFDEFARVLRPHGRLSIFEPINRFGERDLIRHAEDAGFEEIELTLRAEVRSADPCHSDVVVNGAGNPNIPTPAEAMAEALTADEREEFTAYLRPIVESGPVNAAPGARVPARRALLTSSARPRGSAPRTASATLGA